MSPTGVEERLSEARKTFRPRCPIRRRRVASGQDHPVCVELQLCDLTGRKQPVIERAAGLRRCQHQGRFRQPREFTGDQPMRREGQHLVVRERHLF